MQTHLLTYTAGRYFEGILAKMRASAQIESSAARFEEMSHIRPCASANPKNLVRWGVLPPPQGVGLNVCTQWAVSTNAELGIKKVARRKIHLQAVDHSDC